MPKRSKHIPTAVFIRGARKGMKLTQQELADILEVNRYNIAKYETGITIPPGDLVLKVLVECAGRQEN